ncbi:MAG: DUF4389 domain-containing protein [Candidatus ainarchaeum sp.]|nr:DUF4389 domain-containing protein [Candidatus ainarchaeum sp.]
MADVNVNITPGKDVSRLEVIIRMIYGMIVGIVLYLFLIVTYIVILINFFSCLILAKRIAPEFTAKVIAQATKLMAYMFYVTDERPPIIPEL